jgi:hypothetical protein
MGQVLEVFVFAGFAATGTGIKGVLAVDRFGVGSIWSQQ